MKPQEVVLIADPRVLAISIHENHELLINLKEQSEILYGPSPEIENNTCYTFIRETLFEKLKEAQSRLPRGMRLCLYEGLRTLSLQQHLFEHRWNQIKTSHPELGREAIYHEVIKMVSPVTTLEGTQNVPPHSTGGAVDIYLIDAESLLPLEMGILAKDWILDTEGTLSRTISDLISPLAKKHRQILSEVMSSVDFVNYPTEYWHWSYGDRYWAFIRKEPHAFYGSIANVIV